MDLEIVKKHTMPAKQRGVGMKDAVPCKVVDVLGDGNCFYRAISYAITGTYRNSDTRYSDTRYSDTRYP